jgi:putative component of membrane protein insertase Oxa1/YidC/SpoIIIJ protein YidD
MAIKCCYGCVPPKRTPTCKFDGTCNKYAEAKKKHDAEKAEIDKKRAVNLGIYTQRGNKVYEARKRRWKGR